MNSVSFHARRGADARPDGQSQQGSSGSTAISTSTSTSTPSAPSTSRRPTRSRALIMTAIRPPTPARPTRMSAALSAASRTRSATLAQTHTQSRPAVDVDPSVFDFPSSDEDELRTAKKTKNRAVLATRPISALRSARPTAPTVGLVGTERKSRVTSPTKQGSTMAVPPPVPGRGPSSSPKRKGADLESGRKRTRTRTTSSKVVPELREAKSAPSRLSSWLNLADLEVNPGESADKTGREPSKGLNPTRADDAPREVIELDSPEPEPASQTGRPASTRLLSRLLSADEPTRQRRRRLVDSLKAVSFSLDQAAEQEASARESTPADRPNGAIVTASSVVVPAPAAAPQARKISRISSTNSAKVTYGEVRSYLPEAPQSFEEQLDSLFPARPADVADTGLAGVDEAGPAIRSARELRAAGDKTRFVDDIELVLADLEDHSGAAIGRRRTGMRELAVKCADRDFVNRLCMFSFEQRVIALVAKERDPLTLIGWLAVLGFVLTTADGDLAATTVWEAVFGAAECVVEPVIRNLLRVETDIVAIARGRDMNMSRVADTQFARFKQFIVQSPVWFGVDDRCLGVEDDDVLVTPRMVCLRFLDILLSRLRKSGPIEGAILDPDTTSEIVSIAGQVERSLRPASSTARLRLHTELQLALSILETESLSRLAFCPTTTDQLLRLLHRVLATRDLSEISSSRDGGKLETKEKKGPESSAVYFLALRLALNLTNNDHDLCNRFAAGTSSQHEDGDEDQTVAVVYETLIETFSRAVIQLERGLKASSDESSKTTTEEAGGDGLEDSAGQESINQSTDQLILTLGLLINLTEHSDDARLASLDRINQSSIRSFVSLELGSRACADPSSSTSPISAFLFLFFHSHALFNSTAVAILEAESKKSTSLVSKLQVSHGYLAVLIGNLCLNHTAFQLVRSFDLLTHQPQSPSSPVDVLATTIKEFVVYHRAVDESGIGTLQSPGDRTDTCDDSNPVQSDIWTGWTRRLLSVVDRLERSDS